MRVFTTIAATMIIGLGSTSILALQGVIQQRVTFADNLDPYFGSFEVELFRDRDSRRTLGQSVPARGNVASANSWTELEAQTTGTGYLYVSCTEDCESGNFNNGEGIQTNTLSVGSDISRARPRVALILTDSMGQCEVQVRQKTWHRVEMQFNRNGADQQQKTFDFAICSVDVSDTTNRTTLVWSGTTATARTVGGSISVGLDGKTPQVQAGGEWSQTVDQGADSAHVVAEGDFNNTRTLVLGFGGQMEVVLPISVWMTPYASVADKNSYSICYDHCTIQGDASYGTVIGFGVITLLKNNDGSDAGRTVRFNGATLGDPRRLDDIYPVNPWNVYLVPQHP